MRNNQLIEQIAKISQHKRVKGTVIESYNGVCTVSYGGSRLFGVKIIGGIPAPGEVVYIDWNGYEPVVTKAETGASSTYQAPWARQSSVPQGDLWSTGGWQIDTSGIISHDSGNVRFNPINPSIELGSASAYMVGTGVWMGKKPDTYYSVHIGNPAGHYLYFNGTDGSMKFTGEFLGVITETTSDTFEINSDNQDVTVKLIFGRTTPGDTTIEYSGTEMTFNEDSRDINFRFEGNGDANLLFLDAGTDNIGIGVADPDTQLEIYHAGTQLKLSFDGTDNTTFGVDTSGYLTITPSGGRVGIGTAPSTALHILSATTPQYRIGYDGSNFADFSVGAGGNLTLAPTGDLILNPAGNDVLPEISYDINLGALSLKYLTLHAAELWVETLVAQETIATIGGRVMVGPTTELVEDFPATGGTNPNLLLNPSFETAGGGAPDYFANWTEYQTGGAIQRATDYVYDGSYSYKVQYITGQCHIYQDISVTEGANYDITFWARGNGSVQGQYKVYDVTNAADIIVQTNTGVTAAAYSQVVNSFTAPTGCTSARLYLYSSTSSGTVWFDLANINATSDIITVKHNQMQSGDIVYMQANGKVEFMSVAGSYTKIAEGQYEYAVNRNLDGTGKNDWYAGDALFNTGTTGSGFIDLYSYQSINGRSPDYIYNYNNTGTAYSPNYAGLNEWSPFADGANTEANDAIYIGNAATFNQFNVKITTASVVTTAALAYEYWNGSTWASVTQLDVELNGSDADDDNEPFDAVGTWAIKMTTSNWAKNTINGNSAFWFRIRLTGTPTSWTTLPVAKGRPANIGKSQWGPSIVGFVRGSSTFNDIVERWAIGNLNGLYDYGSDTYGSAFGVPSGTWVSIDATNGFRIANGSTILGQWDTTGVVTIGNDDTGYEYIKISGTDGLQMFANGSQRVALKTDGSLWIGNSSTTQRLAWDSTNGLQIFDPSNAAVFQADISGNARFGQVATNYGNMLWDNTAHQLKFRGGTNGTVVQAYIDTDGAITFGGGTGKLNSTGLILETGAGSKKIYFRDAFADADTAVFIQGQTTSTTAIGMYASHISKLAGTQIAQVTIQADTLALSGSGDDTGARIVLLADPDDAGNSYGTISFSVHNGTAWDNKIYIDGYLNKVSIDPTLEINGELWFNDSSTKIAEADSGNAIVITTNSGYVEIGPQNTSWCHFYSDRTSGFYFNSNVAADGDIYGYGYAWASWYASMSYGGWSSKPTGTFYYKKVGKLVFCVFNLSGTANSSSKYVTLPANINSALAVNFVYQVNNAGTDNVGRGQITTGTPGSVYFYTAAGTALSTSGTVAIYGEFWYEEA